MISITASGDPPLNESFFIVNCPKAFIWYSAIQKSASDAGLSSKSFSISSIVSPFSFAHTSFNNFRSSVTSSEDYRNKLNDKITKNYF